jgi:tetratricopeptide (TPR) repeat protein
VKGQGTYKVLAFLVFTLLFCTVATAQKKKKAVEEPQASGNHLREAEFYFTEGEKFFILEDYAKALSYYQKTLEINPDNATVYYKIAEVLERSNRQEDLLKAAVNIDNALRLEKKNKYFYILGANIYSSLTQFSKAAQIYETMIQEIPGSDEYLFELAAVYQYANKLDDAIKTYQRAENVLGINEISSLQKQRLYLEQGKIKDALQEGEKLSIAFPNEERIVMAFAENLSKKGLRSEAVQYLEKFVAQNPDAGSTKMLLAALYRENNMEQKARPLLLTLFQDPEVDLSSKLLILGTYNAELSNARIKNSPDKEKQAFAEQLFHSLELAYQGDVQVYIVGGDLYYAGGKNSEAQKQYLKAVELDDVNFEVWQNLLQLSIQMDQFEKVIEYSDKALELFPNQGILYYYNGYAHFRKKNNQEAVAALEQAKRLSGTNAALIAEINTLLGDVYNGLGDFEKSDKAYEDALAFNPQNPTILNNYSYYLALRKANLEKAERMSADLIKNSPDNPTFLDTYAWVLFTRGKYKEAKKIIEKVISTGQTHATYFEHYGDILYKLGDVDAAVIQWEKARGLNANSENLIKKIANRKIYE